MQVSKFQVIFLGVFVVFIIAGVVAFSTFKGGQSSTTLPTIQVWGTLPAQDFNQFVTSINSTRAAPLNIVYTQKSETGFNGDFIAAIANGTGPDAVLIPQDMVFANESKFVTIPYTSFPERTFIDTYIQEASLYLRSTGIIALPFMVDPLVMYWNKDMVTNAGIATMGTISAPLHWNDFAALDQKLTQKDTTGNIFKSAIALGSFENITHAREILGTLLLQAGNPVTGAVSGSNGVGSALESGQTEAVNPAVAAVSFFSQFANPTSPEYSWNSSLPSSQNFFLSGDLATYFGFASEIATLRNQNPNLNFDVAPMPQATGAAQRLTYGKLYGFSILKTSHNVSAAYTIIQSLLTPAYLSQWSQETYSAPVRRDMIAAGTTDPYLSIFYDAALISQAWLDPNPANTSFIFQNMIDAITSGSETASDAVQNASDKLNLSFSTIQ